MNSMTINLLLIVMLIAGVVIYIGYRVFKGNKIEDRTTVDRARYQFSSIESFLTDKMKELTTRNLYNLGLTKDELERQMRRQKELKETLRNCNTGDISSKTYVREFMYDILMKTYGFDEENVNWVMPFQTPSLLNARDTFDIVLFVYQKKYGKLALGQMIEEYKLADEKEDGGYRIDDAEIRMIFKDKVKQLRYEDKVRIITNRIYSQYKGFGIIDEIRDMSIDGVSGGVSGIPNRMDDLDDEQDLISKMKNGTNGLNSVWVMYRGKTIHLSFLEFEHEAEVRRVVQNIYKYKYPGQLSESNPYIINEMHDGSRVLVVRPKFSESDAFFIRKKYDAKKLELEQLVVHENHEVPITLMKYLMRGNRVTSVTGSQGSGKTTLLMALVNHIHKAWNLRIQETSFELNLRTLYPDRNILSFQETDTISGQDGMDVQKKTDGAVNILGEVATDPVAAQMIQAAQVASLFTIFTHHAKTFEKLVYALRNSLLKTGMFSNEAIAEQQVVGVLEFDIHLRQDYDGRRYIERITECIPIQASINTQLLELDETSTKEDKMENLLAVATNFFHQQTQRRQFEEQNLVEFRNGEYVATSRMSEARIQEIHDALPAAEKEEFLAFIDQFWGNAV